MKLSPKLRTTQEGIAHWCPACNEFHTYVTKPGRRVLWAYDGNADSPTLTPSMKITTGRYVDPNFVDEYPGESTICHYFLTAGKLVYCADSTHELAGKTVDLPDWPTTGDWGNWEGE